MPTGLRLLTRGSWLETQRFTEILRKETVGGVLLLVARGAALVWANSPWSSTYRAMSEFQFGPESLHLHLSISEWAADGLLAIFFFVVGLELKREFVAGDLRDPSAGRAADRRGDRRDGRARRRLHRDQPRRRAPRKSRRVGGADRDRHRVRAGGTGGAVHPPTVGAAHLPADPRGRRRPARHHRDRRVLHRPPVPWAAGAGAGPDRIVRGWRSQRGVHHWWLLVPLAVAAWALVHASGVHATVAGVLLGFTVPVLGRHGRPTAELFEHVTRPVSAGFAVPVFAFFAAGVTVGGWSGLRRIATAPDHRRRDRRPGDWQTPRRLRDRIPLGQVHPCQPG